MWTKVQSDPTVTNCTCDVPGRSRVVLLTVRTVWFGMKDFLYKYLKNILYFIFQCFFSILLRVKEVKEHST